MLSCLSILSAWLLPKLNANGSLKCVNGTSSASLKSANVTNANFTGALSPFLFVCFLLKLNANGSLKCKKGTISEFTFTHYNTHLHKRYSTRAHLMTVHISKVPLLHINFRN